MDTPSERQRAPLLKTKLYIPPIRPDAQRVSRPHLIEQLNRGLHRKLTLVSAPAGFGKTTLLSEWVRCVKRPVAWLSLDPSDDDVAPFWRYVVAALQEIDGSIGETAQAALDDVQSQQLSSGALLTALINEIVAFSTSFVLVLDDYHAIGELAVHETVGFLLERQPPQMHLVIVTREDPPLPLSRLRARGQMTELRASDLRFTLAEAARFFNQTMKLDLSSEEVTALEAKTEGWITGLQLAALSLQEQEGRSEFIQRFAGDDRHVTDYLVDEILVRQPGAVQRFLLQTSILERLSGPLCDAVVYGDASSGTSQSMLEQLEQANLFVVPLDNRRQWYRYHHLFADLLRNRLGLAQRRGILDLHHRASEWYEGNGYENDAVSHALAAHDFERAASLIRRCAGPMLYRGETVMPLKWLEGLPENVIRARPMLCVQYAWALLLSRRDMPSEDIERWLQDAESAVEARAQRSGQVVDALRDEVVAESAVIRTSLAGRARQGDWQSMVALWLQTLERLPRYKVGMRLIALLNLGRGYLGLGDLSPAAQTFDQAWHEAVDRGRYDIAATAACQRAHIARRQGRLYDAAAICREGLKDVAGPVEKPGQHPSAPGILCISLGCILLEQGQREDAARLLAKGLEQIGGVGRYADRAEGYAALARLKQVEGHMADALQFLDQVEASWPEAQSDAYAAALRVRLWTALSQHDPPLLAQATTWARRIGHGFDAGDGVLSVADEWQYTRCLSLVRLHIAQHRLRGEPDLRRVLDYLERQLQIHEAGGLYECAIELLILQTLALDAQGEATRALDALRRALGLAEPEGYFHIFTDEGTPMARLLSRLVAQEFLPDYVGRLLAAFEPEARGTEVLTKASDLPAASLVEPLSARELQVLHLIAEGLTNREIAQRLFISPKTVKRHASSIYGKLDVHSRTQAAARARTLGILSS